ncbi:hypothetical protein [Pimelobacter simplex]|uniref:hypothetical protein n=1 Tax=Nocardioides simplex TaxID=2045 RepID=UPI003AAA687C
MAAAPAGAATWDFFRHSAGLASGGGETAGTTTFGGSGTSVTFSGTTEDVCPPDGLGTSYYLLVDVTEVALDRLSAYKALDTDGCGNGRSAAQGGTMTTAAGRKVVRARAVLCFSNDGNPCWSVPEPGVWQDNPHHP